jgi:alanine-glyoxylate transaminase / serine-glyoxylate transaminase / serine-pyruvate transaminase
MSFDNSPVDELKPPERVLMAPGPTNLPSSVLRALTAPITGHKDPFFLRVMDETAQLLRNVYQTKNQTTLSLPGTGGAGMEASLANLIEDGDEVVVCENGLFGERMADIVRRHGGTVTEVSAPWGKPVDPDDVRRAMANGHAKIVAVVHGETSTGVQQQIAPIGRIADEHDAMLLVDAVATLGGMPVIPDEWGSAICYSASQKCISAPPGLATITVSDRAMDRIRSRKEPVDSWYFDLNLHDKYWFAEGRLYHHTAPVLMVYALREALRIIADEGLETRFERHDLHRRALTAALESLELEFLPALEDRLPTVLSILVPDNVDDARVRGALLNEFGIEIGGGLGPYTGKMWRVGVMGHSASRENVLLFLSALESLLARENYGLAPGTALAAANAVYAETSSTVPL